MPKNPKKSHIAAKHIRRQPGAERRLHAQGVATIEAALSSGEPVLGLYLHTVHIHLLKTLSRDSRFKSIMPHLIGTPALLVKHPGLSQVELAALLGTERATAGLQVSQCIKKGLVRRVVAANDRRQYELYITKAGERLVERARRVVPQHERLFADPLTKDERATLRSLLMKLIARV
jgi:DNA-binding MarR family transcriptional regulator